MKFTFQTIEPTGKWKSFSDPQHLVKLNKKEVGEIDPNTFKIRLAVKVEPTKEKPAPFRWATLAVKHCSLVDVKKWLNENIETIVSKFDLHSFDY